MGGFRILHKGDKPAPTSAVVNNGRDRIEITNATPTQVDGARTVWRDVTPPADPRPQSPINED